MKQSPLRFHTNYIKLFKGPFFRFMFDSLLVHLFLGRGRETMLTLS